MDRIAPYILLLSLVFTSCKKDSVNIQNVGMGQCEYHPSFLWSDEHFDYIEKTIVLDFSSDARADNSSATLVLCDINNAPIDLNKYEILIDGELLTTPEIKISVQQDSVRFKIRPLPCIKSGKQEGYLSVSQIYNLDRVGQVELTGSSEPIQALKWHFVFHNNMNPLAKAIMWILICLFAILLIWIFFLKRVIYPTFRTFTKTIHIPNAAPIIIRFGGAREVIIDNVKHKQGLWNRIFTGKVVYYSSPGLTSSIKFRPAAKRGAFVSSTNYSARPNPMPMIGQCILIDRTNNTNITIQ